MKGALHVQHSEQANLSIPSVRGTTYLFPGSLIFENGKHSSQGLTVDSDLYFLGCLETNKAEN